jgi:hypothetical protein
MEVSKKKTMVVTALGLTLLVGAAPVIAHHAFTAEFDQSRPLNMRGVFQSMDWVNPHSWVHFEVTLPDGTTQLWSAETPPPNQLVRQGWRRTDLQPGDEIVVAGSGAKNGSARMWASSVEIVAQNGEALAEPRRVLNMFSQNPEGLPPDLLPGNQE